MELLGRIVPAIRETRTPLISGYGWLLALWLVVTATTDTEQVVESGPEVGSPLWLFAQAFGVLSEFGLGVALTVAAFIVGSLTGFLWDRVVRPIDERALRDRAARLYSEAQLRLQLAPPTAVALIALADQSLWFLVGLVVPVVLVGHGWALWTEAKRLPVKADLTGQDLSSAHLVGANFRHVDLAGANLQGANFTGAKMDSTNLSDVQLDGAILDNVDLTNIRGGLVAHHLRQIESMSGTQLSGARIAGNLSEANLNHANLEGADLTGANLFGANLGGANLEGANLTGANLNMAKLNHANLEGANLTEAKLFGANLTDAKLTNANLWKADLFGTNLPEANLTRAKLPEGFQPPCLV